MQLWLGKNLEIKGCLITLNRGGESKESISRFLLFVASLMLILLGNFVVAHFEGVSFAQERSYSSCEYNW